MNVLRDSWVSGYTACLVQLLALLIQFPNFEMPSTSSSPIEFSLVPKLPAKPSWVLTSSTKFSLTRLPPPTQPSIVLHVASMPFLTTHCNLGGVLLWDSESWLHHYQDLTSVSSPYKKRVRIENLDPLAPKPYAFVWLFFILNILANTGFCFFLCFSYPLSYQLDCRSLRKRVRIFYELIYFG